MFLLSVVEDKIKIVPEDFDKDLPEVIKSQIESKYSNKVLTDVGLCICFYDFVEIGDPYIYPSEGSSHQLVKFRLVVFRPFVGEVMLGKVISVNSKQIQLSVEFFEDIVIPSNLLPFPSVYDAVCSKWRWKYGAADGNEEGASGEENAAAPEEGSQEDDGDEFAIASGDTVRFAVKTVTFSSPSASSSQMPPKEKQEANESKDAKEVAAASAGENGSSKFGAPAMLIIGGCNGDGFGLVDWW